MFSHCSWYLKSFKELSEVRKKVKRWGKQLCFAEWDTRIKTIEQYPHLLSTLIQAQNESIKQNSDSNIRTLFTPNDIKLIAEDAGWSMINEEVFFSPDLQDGDWEVDKVTMDLDTELGGFSGMPIKLKRLIQSELTMLKESIKSSEIKSLSVYAYTAE